MRKEKTLKVDSETMLDNYELTAKLKELEARVTRLEGKK